MPARDSGNIEQAELNRAFHTWMQKIQEVSQGNGDNIR
jgi:hypothetical protein